MPELTTYQKNALIGKRVELHPATDRWMMGDRFGTIVKAGAKNTHIHLDKSGKTLAFRHDDVVLTGD
jgi:hypothetical protein